MKNPFKKKQHVPARPTPAKPEWKVLADDTRSVTVKYGIAPVAFLSRVGDGDVKISLPKDRGHLAGSVHMSEFAHPPGVVPYLTLAAALRELTLEGDVDKLRAYDGS